MAEPTSQPPETETLRVLHVVQSLGLGGMESVLIRVANALCARGFDFHACCLTERGDQAHRFPDAAQVHELGRKEGFSLRAVFRLRKLVRTLAPDVVHTHNMGPLVYSSLAKFIGSGAPIIHGEHGQIRLKVGSRYEWLSRLLYKACYRVHTVSNNQLEQLRDLRLATASRSLAVVNGVDTELFSPGGTAVREQLGIPAAARILGIVGRLIPSKHHLRLLQGLALLPADVHLLIIGNGPDRQSVEAEIAKLGCGDRVHLTGNICDVLSHYRAMDLLVVPSDSEGLSNVMLEAMACETPALANSYCHGCDEVVSHGEDGWLLPMDSPERIAEAVRAALHAPDELRRRGERSRATMLARFSFEKTANAYESLYRDCAARHRKA